MLVFLRLLTTDSRAVVLVFGNADNANRLAAEVTDSLMNFLLVSFFMVPHVPLSTDYADYTDFFWIFSEAATLTKQICVICVICG